MDYTAMPDDVLIAKLMERPSEFMVLEELALRMRPIILTEPLKYCSQLPIDTDDHAGRSHSLVADRLTEELPQRQL